MAGEGLSEAENLIEEGSREVLRRNLRVTSVCIASGQDGPLLKAGTVTD